MHTHDLNPFEKLMASGHTTWLEIDLDAIIHNIRHIRQFIGDGVALMPVVKANAYGHGAVEVARAAVEAGADRLAVARVIEGVQLRAAGITLPIVVLAFAVPDEMPSVVRYDLTPTLTEMSVAERLSSLAMDAGKTVSIHLKVDTGMGRYGWLPDEVVPNLKRFAALPGLHIEGIFTHFAVADSDLPDDKAYTRHQITLFQQVLDNIRAAGFDIPIAHAANSAGTMYFPDAHFDMVRPGVSIYGMRPNRDLTPPFPLHPALSIKSHVGRVRTLPMGSSISYGRTYTTSKATPVALIPVGYGDGYHRLNSNRGAVLINGCRAPIVGRVCMDQFVVDISGAGDVRVNDEVVLLGKQGNAEISADDLARWAETINYEITTSLLMRAPRVYVRHRAAENKP